jgi:Dolichyl-phosphate-mannose-protein mannosyltransferase
MSRFFTRERFGRPQFLAGLLLLAFAAQAIWLVHQELRGGGGPELSEAARIREGWKQWQGHGIAAAPVMGFADGTTAEQNIVGDDPQADSPLPAPGSAPSGFDPQHSPLLYLASAAPLLAWPRHLELESAEYWRWLPRLPFLACGILLGASLWYVARRLCGNTGGFVALTLYCFSPALVQASAVWHTEPEIAAAWGAFGTIFTAIAVAHTLYAPREVVLWNWRRIVLLGVSLGIAVGSQFPMVVLIPIALAFLMYVAPVRRRAGIVIWIAACVVGVFLLFGFYFFHPRVFSEGLRHAEFWGATWRGFAVLGVYKQVAVQIGRACPALILALPVALVTYVVWPRARYFGNTAPLLIAALFVALGMAHPHVAGEGFLLASVPFIFIFVAGALADLMETPQRRLVRASVLGLLVAYAAWSIVNLARVPIG